MEAMSAPPPSRHTPFLHQTGLRVPSLPIPIPARRIATDPPPRSPDREHSSSDLVFEMSPVTFEDAPLKDFDARPKGLGDVYRRMPYMPFSRLATCSGSPVEEIRPYAHEPFLYSIPRLPPRMSLGHGRSQSEALSPTQLSGCEVQAMVVCGTKTQPASISCSPSAASPVSKGGVEMCSPYPIQTALTDAFQNSVSSGATSSFPPSPVDSTGTSLLDIPTSSVQDIGSCTASDCLLATKRRGNMKKTYPTDIMRTSAAAPVLSFAQVERGSTGLYARDSRVGRGKPKSPPCPTLVSRARSPYPLVRGRRNSILRERSMRFSDDDISGTLRHDRPLGNFGLEKYLSAGAQKRKAKDENAISDALVEKERGRTRSRARGGLRQ